MISNKSMAMQAKTAAYAVSQISGVPVLAEEIREMLSKANGDAYDPSDIRRAHSMVRMDRAELLNSKRDSGDRKIPPFVVCHFTKGGVGKTTIAANVAHEIARFGLRVLFIDADPQGTATSLFGIDVDDISLRTLHDILFGKDGMRVALKDAVIPIFSDATLDLIPSDMGMSRFDLTANSQAKREFLMQKLVASNADFFSQYDIVLVDTNPGSNLLNQNLMIAADHVLIPVMLDILSVKSMKLMFAELSEVQDIDPADRGLIFVANADQPNTNHCKASLDQLKRAYDEQLMKSIIPSYAGFKRQGWGGQEDPQLLIEKEPASPAGKMLTELALEIAGRVLWPQEQMNAESIAA